MTVFHTPCTWTDETFCREAVPYISEIVGEDNVKQIPPMTGNRGFRICDGTGPGMFAFIGAGAPGNAPLHSPRMVLDEAVLPIGAAVHANVAVSWLRDHRRAEEKMKQKAEKKGFHMPHVFIILLVIMLFIVVLSYIIPSGMYERIEDSAGITVIDPDTFSYVENENPIGFMDYFEAVYTGFVNGAHNYGHAFYQFGSDLSSGGQRSFRSRDQRDSEEDKRKRIFRGLHLLYDLCDLRSAGIRGSGISVLSPCRNHRIRAGI